MEKDTDKETLIRMIAKIRERIKIKIPRDVDYKEMIRQWRYQDYINQFKK